MPNAIGIHTHPQLKLGKAPARNDPRNLKMAMLLAPQPPPPANYDFDATAPGIAPNPVFGNDKYGDCVIAARLHQIRRFEFKEQGIFVPATERIAVGEYFRESGGEDVGL